MHTTRALAWSRCREDCAGFARLRSIGEASLRPELHAHAASATLVASAPSLFLARCRDGRAHERSPFVSARTGAVDWVAHRVLLAAARCRAQRPLSVRVSPGTVAAASRRARIADFVLTERAFDSDMGSACCTSLTIASLRPQLPSTSRRGRPVDDRPSRCFQERPYHRGHAASRSICEAKHGRGQSVLRSGTTRESCAAVLFAPAGAQPGVAFAGARWSVSRSATLETSVHAAGGFRARLAGADASWSLRQRRTPAAARRAMRL